MKKSFLINCLTWVLFLFTIELYSQVPDSLEEKPVQYRRGVELKEGYQSYYEKYSGKNLNEEKRKSFPLTDSSGVWTELHPNIPRVTYLGVHFQNQDTGWAVGDLSAIIKTTSGGEVPPDGRARWNVSQTNAITLLLTVHSFNGQIVITSGFDGVILRSTDRGETFAQVISGVGNGTDLWAVQMLNDTVGFICGLNQTLLKTTDAGLTWLPVNAGLNAHYWALDFLNEQYGMIACSGGKVLKTTNGGNSWTEHQAGDGNALYTIDIIDSLHIAAAGANGKNVYSSDGGITWTQNNRLFHDEVNSIKFIDENTGYIVGTYGNDSWGIRKTTDRGQNWFNPPMPNLSEWELALLPDGVGYSVGTNLSINKTTGGYDNWGGLFLNAQFVDVFFTDELTGYAADGRWTGGPLYKTTNGGLSWFALPNFPSQVFTSSLRSITFTDSVTGFAGSAPARIVKTTDAGESWYIVNRTGLTDTIGLINKFFFINPTTGWAVTTRGGILKTTDTGENWFAQLNAGASVIFQSIHFVDSLYGWTANTSRRPHKTTDGGNNWVHQTNLDFFISSDVYFANKDTGWITNDYTGYILHRTNNGGVTWQTVNGLFAPRKFSFFPDKCHWWVNGFSNLYETTTGGDDWENITPPLTIFTKFNAPVNWLGYGVGNLGYVVRYFDSTYVPVELISFEGNIEGSKVMLTWQTASELNNRGFEIEKSIDKNNWFNIGFVEGKGTTTEKQFYSFVDENLNSGSYLYRLKQVDFDGTFAYSKIIEVETGVPYEFLLSQNYPNPFNPGTNIEFHIPNDGKASLIVYDILGSEVATLVNEEKPAGRYEVTFNATSLASGVYFYKLTIGGNTQVRKMILLR